MSNSALYHLSIKKNKQEHICNWEDGVEYHYIEYDIINESSFELVLKYNVLS